MKNNKLIKSLIAFLAFSNFLMAQNVEVIRKAERLPEYEAERFSFITPNTDTSRLQFVATLRATGVGKNMDLEMVFNKLKEKAQTLGGNAFKLRQFSRIDEIPKTILTLDVYFASDSVLKLNHEKNVKNMVYIIGSTEKSDKTYSFKIDNLKKEIKGGTFYQHENKEGQEVKINKGGFTGTTVWIKWKKKQTGYLSNDERHDRFKYPTTTRPNGRLNNNRKNLLLRRKFGLPIAACASRKQMMYVPGLVALALCLLFTVCKASPNNR